MSTSYRHRNITRNENEIRIHRFDHPRVASDLINEFYHGTRAGYTSFSVTAKLGGQIYPNAIVPMASIFHYYSTNRIDIKYFGFTDYLKQCSLAEPKIPSNENIRLGVYDVVWKFKDFDCVSLLVDAFVEETSKKVVCEKGVIEGLTWCLNEVMDNILQHSESEVGFIMGQVHKNKEHLSFCISDPGIGIFNSLRNTVHRPRSAVDAITLSIKEGVTRNVDIGQGNGMWGLHQIVLGNSGGLTITSHSGSYFLRNDEVKTFNKIPFLSKTHGGTIIDFQLNYSESVSISQALKGHEPVNARIENLQDSTGSIHYSLLEQSSETGTRKSGERIRTDIVNLIKESESPVTIDFKGISVVSSSFADELLGKLVLEFGFFGFNQAIKLINMNETVQTIVHRSVSQRMAGSLK